MNNINAFLNSIESPSTHPGEKGEIQSFVNQVSDLFPGGITVLEALENLPEDIPYSVSLKILIELAKNKLLNFSQTNGKISPKNVLDIYGNHKDISNKVEFNLNEGHISLLKILS